MVRKNGFCSRLDLLMFNLTIWMEQQRAIAVLQAISESTLKDANALNVEGDYFSIRLPNGENFQGLLLSDNARKVQKLVSSFNGGKYGEE